VRADNHGRRVAILCGLRDHLHRLAVSHEGLRLDAIGFGKLDRRSGLRSALYLRRVEIGSGHHRRGCVDRLRRLPRGDHFETSAGLPRELDRKLVALDADAEPSVASTIGFISSLLLSPTR
jgi:hypothetical protein